jgi:hypothetical protein
MRHYTILDSRQRRFAARLVESYTCKLIELHRNPSSGSLIYSVVNEEHDHSWTTEGMNCPPSSDQSEGRTTILEDTLATTRAVLQGKRVAGAKIATGVWVWHTNQSLSDDGLVPAAAVSQHGIQLRSCHSYMREDPHNALITKYARPRTVDAPLALIFRIWQGAGGYCFCQ